MRIIILLTLLAISSSFYFHVENEAKTIEKEMLKTLVQNGYTLRREL